MEISKYIFGRWCLVQDDDTHWYLIPADDREEFFKWVSFSDDHAGWRGTFFDDCRIDGPHVLTFTAPEIK